MTGFPISAGNWKPAESEMRQLHAGSFRFCRAGVQRGSGHPVDVRLAPTEAERRPVLCAGVQGRQRTAGVKGQRLLAGYRAAAPVRSVEAASLYSGVQRWKTSAQGKLMPASTCTGYYLTQTFAGFAASPPLPRPRSIFTGRRKSV